MTTIIQTTNGSGIVSLNDDINTYVLAAGATHVGRIDLDIASNSRTFIQISGSFIAQSTISLFSAPAAVTFVVTATGSLTSASATNFVDLRFSGDNSILNNAGNIVTDNISITGNGFELVNSGNITEAPISNLPNGSLFRFQDFSATISNTGTITAISDAFEFLGANPSVASEIKNLGEITSSAIAIDTIHAITVQNSGTISGNFHAIDADEDFVLLNSGTINALGDAIAFGIDGRVTNTGTILSNSDGIEGGANASVFNSGDISGQLAGLKLGGSSEVSNDGQIVGFLDGVSIGDNSSLTNTGEITSVNDIGVDVGSDTSVSNTGVISGEAIGVRAGLNATVLNDGDILSTNIAVALNNGALTNGGVLRGGTIGLSDSGNLTVSNNGEIHGNDTGVDVGGALVFINAGALSSSNGAAIDASSGFTIRSSGTITASDDLIRSDAATGQTVSLNNSGTMQGGEAVIDTDFANINITNSGVIDSLTGVSTAGSLRVVNDGVMQFGGDFAAVGSYVLRNTDMINMTGNGLVSSAGFRNVFNNQGTFISNLTALTDAGLFSVINNVGTVIGSTAMSLTGGGHTINNSGTIQSLGNVAFGPVAGIDMDNSGGFRIQNSGEIYGATNGIDAGLATSTHIFNNIGTIQGGSVHSIFVSNAGQVDTYGHEVNNRGTLLGDVQMSEGDDLYYGKWGTIDGDIILNGGDDIATGGAEDNRIEGGTGNDRLNGLAGDDNLFGDDGNDILRGGDGDDGVNGGADNDDLGGGAGDDVLLGADGNDLLRGDMGADVLNGGDGFDRASYRDSSEGITLDLADTSLSTGFAQGDSYVSIEAYEATNFNDIMFGDDVNNLLRGYDGDDQISGRGGNDNLQGFDGDDILSGGTGNDTLNGGDGDDVAAFTGDQADYTFTLLGNGNIRVEDTVGSDGIDVLIAVEFVTFGGGAEIDVTGLI